jgi:hypothetical protein
MTITEATKYLEGSDLVAWQRLCRKIEARKLERDRRGLERAQIWMGQGQAEDGD